MFGLWTNTEIYCSRWENAPTLRKVDHLSELDRHEDDENILEQGSHFKDRVFLSRKPERTLVTKLLTNDINADEFVN